MSAESVPADAPAEVVMTGLDQDRKFAFKVPRGLPGVNGVENDAAVATYMAAEDSQTRQQLDATINLAAVPPLAKRSIVVYGHSYTIEPSPHSTDGHEFFNLIADQSGSPSVVTHGVSSSRATQTFYDVQGDAPGSAVPGSNLFILDTEANDFAHRSAANGSYYNPWPTQLARQFGWAVSAILARLSSRAVVEQSEGSTSGVWTRNAASAVASDGSFDFTTTPGAYIDIPVTITEEDSGVVFVMLLWTTTAGADAVISVDGTPYSTVVGSPTGDVIPLGSGRAVPGGGALTQFFQPVRVSGLSIGAHTIRVAHAGVAGRYLDVDCALIQAASPEPVVWLRDQPPVAGRDQTLGINDAKVAIYKANKALGITETDPIFAQFPNVIVIEQTDYLDAGSVSTTDGLHPNDKGNARMAARIMRALALRGQNADY
ncbi:hypothetical protein [Microbacterium aerolatum]|uniref:hypothetical protein n=1 Tax=Microbacterium aerolatum TaxID=153731 RepID=UPI00384B23A0